MADSTRKLVATGRVLRSLPTLLPSWMLQCSPTQPACTATLTRQAETETPQRRLRRVLTAFQWTRSRSRAVDRRQTRHSSTAERRLSQRSGRAFLTRLRPRAAVASRSLPQAAHSGLSGHSTQQSRLSCALRLVHSALARGAHAMVVHHPTPRSGLCCRSCTSSAACAADATCSETANSQQRHRQRRLSWELPLRWPLHASTSKKTASLLWQRMSGRFDARPRTSTRGCDLPPLRL